MSLSAQAKVLRVLQDGVVTRIGGSKPIAGGRARARGDEQGSRGRDRRGAIPRGSVLPAERRADPRAAAARAARGHPALVAHFAEALAESAGVPGKKFAEDAVARLQTLDWPGNVRELRNTIERVLILAPGKVVTADDIDRLAARRRRRRCRWRPRRARAQTFEAFKQEAEKNFLLAASCASATGTCPRRRARSRCRARICTRRSSATASRGSRHERAAEELGSRAGRHRQGDRRRAACRRRRIGSGAGRPRSWCAHAARRSARRSVALTWFWVLLAVALAAALLLWPYQRVVRPAAHLLHGRDGRDGADRRCSARSASWAHRRGFAHVLSLAVVLWSGVVALREVLPRVGYAKPTRTWTCEAPPRRAAAARRRRRQRRRRRRSAPRGIRHRGSPTRDGRPFAQVSRRSALRSQTTRRSTQLIPGPHGQDVPQFHRRRVGGARQRRLLREPQSRRTPPT